MRNTTPCHRSAQSQQLATYMSSLMSLPSGPDMPRLLILINCSKATEREATGEQIGLTSSVAFR